MDNQKITSDENAIVAGLQQAAQTLKNTITTVQIDDVSVTITAEPTVIDIQIAQNADIHALPETLKQCLNEAFRKSIENVLEQANKSL